MRRAWMAMALALLGAAGCGHVAQDERLRIMLDELTFIRQDLKQQQKLLAELRAQLEKQVALLTRLKDLRDQLAALERERPTPASDTSPLPSGGAIQPMGPGPSLDYSKLVRRTGVDAYAIRRAELTRVLANSAEISRGARIVPEFANGKPVGFRLYAIRPDSLQRAMGLENGDTILEVAGFPLTSPEKALEAYTKLRHARSIEVKIRRRGLVRTFKYTIAD